jgi:lipoprotein-anchoring transpeptidase ErfK/SrfK
VKPLPALVALSLVAAAAAASPSLAESTQPPDAVTPALTVASPAEQAPAGSSSTGRAGRAAFGAHVESVFPAAGTFTVKSVSVRRTPNPQAPVVKVMTQFRDDYRVQEVFAVGRRMGGDHRAWYEISVPMRPNGTMGWIPARTVKLAPTVAEIQVHRVSRTIDLYSHGKHVWHGGVAVGAPGMETPLGNYYVAARFVPYQDPFLGVFAVETSGYSRLTEWPGGGWFGIHGTSKPWLIGKAVSHGCIRVTNLTATKLEKYSPLGTPIVITDT